MFYSFNFHAKLDFVLAQTLNNFYPQTLLINEVVLVTK